MPLRIRQQRQNDAPAIARVIDAAFGDSRTAEFTSAIRASEGYVSELTFVGEEDGDVVGYTMLSYVRLGDRRVLTLTPMAVRPDRQRQGIGTRIVQAAVAAADERGEPFVLVEGVPSFDPRFGFRSASELGVLRPDPRIPEADWLALPLFAYDAAIQGRVVYQPFFPPPPDA